MRLCEFPEVGWLMSDEAGFKPVLTTALLFLTSKQFLLPARLDRRDAPRKSSLGEPEESTLRPDPGVVSDGWTHSLLGAARDLNFY